VYLDELPVEAGVLEAVHGRLHAVPPPMIDDWFPADWDEFVADQWAGCAGRHRAIGLPAEWARQTPGFLDRVDLTPGQTVLLHTEVMRHHLLVDERGDLSGTAGSPRRESDCCELPG
jgi:hygromycin-B 7''-O-kinase